MAICPAAMAGVAQSSKGECEKYDVLVVGGGVSGCVAAIQSAREGAKTLLVESSSQLGGTMTTAGVNYPGLEDNEYYPLVKKYMPKGASSIISFGIKGGKEAGVKFIENVKLLIHATNIGDSRSIITYPCLTTHRQLNDEQLKACGISECYHCSR